MLVSVPNQSGYIYLITNRLGQFRLVLISRPTINGEMFGIMTTLQAGRGAQLIPVAAPIAYVPLDGLGDVEFGRIAADHPRHDELSRLPPAHGRGAVRAVPAGIAEAPAPRPTRPMAAGRLDSAIAFAEIAPANRDPGHER